MVRQRSDHHQIYRAHIAQFPGDLQGGDHFEVCKCIFEHAIKIFRPLRLAAGDRYRPDFLIVYHGNPGRAEKMGIAQRFEFLEARLNAGPSADEIARISREYAELKPVVAQIAEWRAAQDGIREAQAMLADAEMRELWTTGWMHNRVRMVAASFLVKHLMIDWREGERWFWDTLLDADLANNAMGWQWVTGSGVDSAPYYRIFSPQGQAEKFDTRAYLQRWLPEFGSAHYPPPLVDHRWARERALAAFVGLKEQDSRTES